MLREVDGDVWIDGAWRPSAEATVSLLDPGLLHGVGVFETLSVRRGTCLDVERHLDRLASGAATLGLGPPDRAALGAALAELARRLPATGWAKIVVTGGGRHGIFGGEMDAADEGRPATAVLLPWRRALRDPLAGCKTLSYAANQAGIAWARERGADEGLWLNSRGHLAEGCSSNLFAIRRGSVYTASPGEGILPGVVRGRLLEAAAGLGLRVHEGRFRVPRLAGADEALLTSSLRGVRPLIRVDGRAVGGGREGPWSAKLKNEVDRLRRAGAGTHIGKDDGDPRRVAGEGTVCTKHKQRPAG